MIIITVIGLAVVVSYAEAACEDQLTMCPKLISLCRTVSWVPIDCPATCGACNASMSTQAPPETSMPIQCGQSLIQSSRVIAGTTAIPNSWPWQVLMILDGVESCGGSLISPTWVVTAAHCVDKDTGRPRAFKIRVGEHNFEVKEGPEVDYAVAKVIAHDRYDRRTLDYDIALFKLAKPVIMNKHVSTICLPDADVPSGTDCYITGWGKIEHPGDMHEILQQAKMTVVDRQACADKNKQRIRIPVTSRMICAGSGGTDRIAGCHGDSGGPLVCHVGGRWELQGAVSHGSPECKSNQTYTVFSRIPYFKSWIETTMLLN